MPEGKLQMALLFDLYGELLTEKQRRYCDLYYNEDLSLSEIAESEGITRQGVHDIISRAESTLAEAEEKTGVLRKFSEIRAEIGRAAHLAGEICRLSPDGEVGDLARRLLNVLDSLKGEVPHGV